MSKEIQIGEKKVIIKELTYLDSLDVADLKDREGLRAAVTKQIELSTNLSVEEIKALTLKEGAVIQTEINKMNSTDPLDFQKPTEEKGN